MVIERACGQYRQEDVGNLIEKLTTFTCTSIAKNGPFMDSILFQRNFLRMFKGTWQVLMLTAFSNLQINNDKFLAYHLTFCGKGELLEGLPLKHLTIKKVYGIQIL